MTDNARKVIIGCDARLCPDCYRPLSYRDERPFCRNCQKQIKLNPHTKRRGYGKYKDPAFRR